MPKETVSTPQPGPDHFDQWAGSAPAAQKETVPTTGETDAVSTPVALRHAVQELLKHGTLEQGAKPHMYRQITSDLRRVNVLLEPLDLRVVVDDLRGLAFVVVAAPYPSDNEGDDEWTHPLVRRQRLTLEQSLLLAILRREFLQREQEHGLGLPVQLVVDGLLPQLQIYLGNTGSDMQDRKRLLVLLEGLRGHGVVSEVDGQDKCTIRPMIVHVANPENLQALLRRLREVAAEDSPLENGA